MGSIDSDWQGDGPEVESLASGLRDLRDLREELSVSPPSSRASIERGSAVQESKRKSFATGPDALEAAMALHNAMNIPTLLVVTATFVDRMIGRVDDCFNDARGTILTRIGQVHSPV